MQELREIALKTKIFYAADVHGSERCFLKFLNAWKFYKADALILSGDLLGKAFVPIVEYPDHTFKARFSGKDYVLSSGDQLDAFEKEIRNTGVYPYRTNVDDARALEGNPTKQNEIFQSLANDSMARWARMADERLANARIRCFISPGNDDLFSIDEILAKGKYLKFAEGKPAMVSEEHPMITWGCSNITPWNCIRDVTEEELAKKIDELVLQVGDMKHCIFNFHCPPHNTNLDVAPKLDKDLKPVASGSIVDHVGSTAIRNAIEKYQPLLGLHGHIHESRGTHRLGRTVCVNPGSEYMNGILRGILVSLNGERVESYVFTSG